MEHMGGSSSETTVAIFSDAPYVGGAERYLMLLAAGIAKNGFRPVLIAAGGEGLAPLCDKMRSIGVEVHELPGSKGAGKPTLIGLYRSLRRVKPALFHINLPGSFDAWYGMAAPVAWMAGVRRIVSTEHLPMYPSFAKARVLKGLSMRFISRVITVSEDNRAHLTRNHRIPERKIRVVLNGIAPADGAAGWDLRAELGIGADSFLVAVVGALEERKGHATLFEALGRLPDAVHALVVGEGRIEKKLREMCAALEISGRVHFMGYRDDVASILRSIDALVVPSIVEATPYVIIEAMEAGLPVVASSVFGIPEMVEDGETGILFPPDDIEALARAIENILNDPDKRESMGRIARERYSARFTLDRCIRETIEIYRESAGG